MCNPPFFHNHPKSPERKRNLARHDDTLPHVLFTQARRDHEAGVFQFVFPTDRAEEVRAQHKEGWLLSSASHSLECFARAHTRPLDVVKHVQAMSIPQEDVLLTQKPGHGSWAPWLKHRSAFLKENEGGFSNRALGATCPPELATGLWRPPPRLHPRQNQ